VINEGGRDGQDMWHVWGKRNVFRVWWGNAKKKRNHFKNFGADGVHVKMDLK
jgi:hypothetical protein